jgi:TIR domain
LGVDSLNRVGSQTGAVFLSYASQDADAAQRICVALRAAGIEVWFDQSELRGGDAWARQIRQRIHDCRLFTPLISAHTDDEQASTHDSSQTATFPTEEHGYRHHLPAGKPTPVT